MKKILALLAFLALQGCATQTTLYEWGNYESAVYKHFNNESPEEQGGFKSEVQHLPPSKVSRCKAAHPSAINNSSLRIV